MYCFWQNKPTYLPKTGSMIEHSRKPGQSLHQCNSYLPKDMCKLDIVQPSSKPIKVDLK